MSKRDYGKYKKEISKFRYKPIRYIAATNSLKIQCCRNSGRGKPYIWIDPSWELFRNGKFYTSSRAYPYHTEPLYLNKHRMWCKKLKTLHGKLLLSVTYKQNNFVIFRFSGGVTLSSFSTDAEYDSSDDYDYDDWYADSSS